jgi:hypothetical protein
MSVLKRTMRIMLAKAIDAHCVSAVCARVYSDSGANAFVQRGVEFDAGTLCDVDVVV